MMKAEQKQMVWMEFYLAVVKCCKEDCSAHCDAFAVERRNHLGSVTRTYNSSGTAVFSAEYDPWGVQRQLANSIRYHRGYCGHEMLNDLQLINMRSATSGDAFVTTWRKNGRLYDPYIGRFFSPDNYVQLPTSAQSFNRYSYCLNNPLKYTDPSGELFGIDDMLLFGIISGAMMGAASAHMHGGSILKGAFLGAASAAVPYGIGSAFGHGLGSVGHELLRAGAHGLANGALNAVNGGKFGAGLLSGFAGSFAGSGAQALGMGRLGVLGSSAMGGGLGSLMGGGSWRSGMQAGLNIGMYNHGWKKDPQGWAYEMDEVMVTAPYPYKSTFGYALFGDLVGGRTKDGGMGPWSPDAVSVGVGVSGSFLGMGYGIEGGVIIGPGCVSPYVSYTGNISANGILSFYRGHNMNPVRFLNFNAYGSVVGYENLKINKMSIFENYRQGSISQTISGGPISLEWGNSAISGKISRDSRYYGIIYNLNPTIIDYSQTNSYTWIPFF